MKWLAQTQGLGDGCFWFAFNEIRSTEFVINRMGEALFVENFSLAEIAQRIDALTGILNQQRFIIVWDNFEVVQGIPVTEVKPVLSRQDRDLLLDFLRRIRGGQSKVIITNRSEEDWLGVDRRKVDVSGLTGEERWLFMKEILGSMGIAINRADPDLAKLMDLLNGHPLAMRVILPMLEKQGAASVIEVLQQGSFHLFGATFYSGINEAEALEMDYHFRTLLQALASYVQNTLNFEEANTLFEHLADSRKKAGWLEGQAAAYLHLGIISELFGINFLT